MPNTKILIIEDESIVALDIKLTLESFEYKVTGVAKSFTQALEKVQLQLPELILMDINLKNSKDGIETAQEIQKSYNIPIIYLTAYTDEETIQRAISTNPVGYLIKPFNTQQLKATIKLALFKAKDQDLLKQNIDDINLGNNYYYNVKAQLAFYNNQPIKLSKNENLFLILLLEANGNLVHHSDIEYHIWTDEAVSSEVLRSLVYRLRTKFDYKIIETIPSFGYKLVQY